MTQKFDESQLTPEQKQINSIANSLKMSWTTQGLKALEISEVNGKQVIRSTVNGVVAFIEESPNHWIERPNMTWTEALLAQHPSWTREDLEDQIQAFGF